MDFNIKQIDLKLVDLKLKLQQILQQFYKTKKVTPTNLRFKAEPLIAAFQGEILNKYTVDQATVFIVDQDGKGLYIVSEPEMNPEEQRVYSLLMENLFFTLKPLTKMEDPLKYVEGFMWDAAQELGIVGEVQKSFQKIRYFVIRDAFGYGPIHIPMNDPQVEEVSCTSYGNPITVIHRQLSEYDWLQTNISFSNEDILRNFVQKLAQRTGHSVTVATPWTDAMTKEGHRLAVTFAGEVTLPGSTFCIRKFPEAPFSMAHLLQYKTLTPLMAAYFWLLTEYKGYVMVLGPMGSGKTSFLNSLLTMTDPTLKIASIEDTNEVRIPHSGWQRFKARHTYSITESKYDVGLFDLVKLSLRYRPDYIVVGEIRGEEIQALTQAASLGHGALCTFHAESPEAALVRMRSPPMEVSEGGLMLIWCFALLNRVRTYQGKVARRLLDAVEVEPKDGKLTLKRIFSWDARTDTFTPQTAEEVANKSPKLKTIMRLTGWTEKELVNELDRRANYLQSAVDEGKLEFAEFSEAIRKFYVSSRRHESN
ncbi:MAG: type II/IV secretion system ATPase subunit [Candidatus Bathyarchaeia archaeon]|jgi:flagellar protein FlaI